MCLGLDSVCEDEGWGSLGTGIGTTSPGIEGNTNCASMGMTLGPFACVGCLAVDCWSLWLDLPGLNSLFHNDLFSLGGGGGG